MSNIPLQGQIFRHFKGNLYRIITMARHSETGEELVIYQALYGDFQVYARPLSMFLDKLDKEKYPNAGQECRFELQKNVIEPVAEPEPFLQEEAEEAVVPDKEEKRQEIEEPAEELNIDPLVLEFLDAGTYEERVNILAALHHRITDDMINIMSMAIDVKVDEGDVEDRFAQLRTKMVLFSRAAGCGGIFNFNRQMRERSIIWHMNWKTGW